MRAAAEELAPPHSQDEVVVVVEERLAAPSRHLRRGRPEKVCSKVLDHALVALLVVGSESPREAHVDMARPQPSQGSVGAYDLHSVKAPVSTNDVVDNPLARARRPDPDRP